MSAARKGLLALGILGVAGAVWYVVGLPSDAVKSDRKSGPAVPVIVAKVSVRDVPVLLEVTGRTEAYETVTIKSRVEGQVRNLVFAEGQHVRQGDLLLQLDPADLQAKLNQAQATQARSQALLTKARADIERYVALRAKGFVSDEKVSEVRAAAAAAEAAAAADSATAELSRLQLSYTTIKAPISGVVGAKLVFPGATVKLGDTALAVVNRVRPLYVSFAVPEKYLPALQAARRGNEKALTASVALPGSDGNYEGQVHFVDNAVDVSTGTILLKAVLSNEQEVLASGQFVNVSLKMETVKSAIVVPAEAVQQGAAGSFVFVLKADETVEVRPVRVSIVQKNQAVIAEGLTDGDTVVVEGQLRLTSGARVKLPDAPKAAG